MPYAGGQQHDRGHLRCTGSRTLFDLLSSAAPRFLIPVALLVFLLSEAMHAVETIAAPIAAVWPGDRFLGIGIVAFVSALVLLTISFLAGLLARTESGRQFKNRLETSLLGRVPQYQMIKSMAEGFAKVQNAESLKPSLIERDGVLHSLAMSWIGSVPTPWPCSCHNVRPRSVRDTCLRADSQGPESRHAVKRCGHAHSETRHGLRRSV
jgi:hypothetical protein